MAEQKQQQQPQQQQQQPQQQQQRVERVDGSEIKRLVEDGDAFAKFVEGKFEELSKGSSGGGLSAEELQPAVMGIGMAVGLPPMGNDASTDRVYHQVMQAFVGEDGQKASKQKFGAVLRDMLLGVADGLEREPVELIVLDGSKLRQYASSADAEITAVTTFNEATVDSGSKVVKASLLRAAVSKLSAAQGAPPAVEEESRQALRVAFNRAGVDEEACVDQIQFVDLFRRILRELSALLEQKPLTVAHVEKVFDGRCVRDFLSNKDSVNKELRSLWETLRKEKHDTINRKTFICALDTIAPKVGLPPLGAVEEVDNEVKSALNMVDSENKAIDRQRFELYMREVLGALMLQLEGKPILIKCSSLVSGAQQQQQQKAPGIIPV